MVLSIAVNASLTATPTRYALGETLIIKTRANVTPIRFTRTKVKPICGRRLTAADTQSMTNWWSVIALQTV